jgi:nitrate reductase gamma subunit
MSETELLNWLRGTGLQIAIAIFVVGLLFRVVQNLLIGTNKNLAAPRGSKMGPGLATIVRRSFFHPHMTYRGYFTLIAGYIFHLGFLITLFFLSQHILLFKSILGFSWPAMPPAVIDITAILGIAALIAVLIHRLIDPVLKQISDYQDYLAWFLTIFPLATGFLLMHPMGMSYNLALALHILSFELLIIAIPFTKLSHMLSIFISRWYNGAMAGYKGIKQ